MNKSAWLAATKNLKVGDAVHVVLRGFPFDDYSRQGELSELSESAFTLKMGKELFSRSSQRVVSIDNLKEMKTNGK